MLFRYKKLNAYPVLCMNGCRIESVQYNDSYVNLIFKDGFLKRNGRRTKDAMISVEGDEEVLNIYFSEVLPRENEPPHYKTRELPIEKFGKIVSNCEVEISEEYHSANRIILRGEIFRPVKRLEFKRRRLLFELKLRTKKDLRLFYYFND